MTTTIPQSQKPQLQLQLQPDILMLGPQLDLYVQAIDKQFENVHKYWQIEDKEAFLQQHAQQITAIATNGVLGAKKALLEQLPNLKIIASSGVGYDAIDVEYAKSRNIIVTNTPDVLNDAVADVGMMLIYAVARQLVQADHFVKSGGWRAGAYPLTTNVTNKVCGIFGLGGVGKAVAKRAQACGMKIAYTARSDKHIAGYEFFDNLAALAQASDFLVLAIPSTPDTHHIVTADILQKLGSQGFLINIARGNVVDENALIQALKTQTIAGAGLDVFENEPCIESELFSLPQVTLTPHYASGTAETRQAMADLAVANLQAYFSSGQPLTAI